MEGDEGVGRRLAVALGERPASTGASGLVVAVAASLLWMAVLAVGVGYAVLLQLLGPARCEPFEGGSTYGDPGWSILPPGPTCTFTADVHGFDEVRGPTPVMSVWLAVLVVGGAACAALVARVRLARR